MPHSQKTLVFRLEHRNNGDPTDHCTSTERSLPMPHHQRTATCMIFAVCILALLLVSIESVHTQSPSSFVTITDDMLQDPSDEDWLMWRRTLDSWGYSPLDEINTDNVDQLRLVWSRGLRKGHSKAHHWPITACSICRTQMTLFKRSMPSRAT